MAYCTSDILPTPVPGWQPRSEMTNEEREKYDYENRTPLYLRGPGAKLRKNPESKWWVYVIALRPKYLRPEEKLTRSNACYYVGYSTDPEKRLEVHKASRKNSFVALHEPIKIMFKECHGDDQDAALNREHEITIKLMKQYGISRVRGAKYFRAKLWNSETKEIESQF